MNKIIKKRIMALFFAAAMSVQSAMGATYMEMLKNAFESIKNSYLGRTISNYISQHGSQLLTAGMGMYMMSKMYSDQAKGLVTHSIKPVKVTDVTLKDYIGFPPEVEILVDQIKNKENYTKLNAPFTKGILLTGNPGTGKTFLAKAVAGEAGCPFFSLSATELEQPFRGVSRMMIEGLFNNAKRAAFDSPSKVAIIFIDELDAIGSRSKTGGFGESASPSGALQTLLTQMDGFSTISAEDLNLPFYEKMKNIVGDMIGKPLELPEISVVMFGATNAPNNIDPALKRPGRFDTIIEVRNPNEIYREKIIESYLQKHKDNYSSDVEAKKLAISTEGMTPAAIKTVFQEAAREAAFKAQAKIEIKNFCRALFVSQGENAVNNDKRKALKILITMYPCDTSVTADRLINKKEFARSDIESIADTFETVYKSVKEGQARLINLEDFGLEGYKGKAGMVDTRKNPEYQKFLERFPQTPIKPKDTIVKPEAPEDLDVD